ncbi:hypothetical protein C8R44DRAFT_789049 [Mycena epipterygia]|nr:hypothetical protein C8R44DRAFT_789049 [Mycena epipterygia]
MDKSGALAKLIADALAAADEPCFLKEELEIVPEHVVDVSDRSANADAPPDIRIITPSTIERTRTYRGPVVDIHTTVQWQTPGRGTNCEHLQKDSPGPRPPTATVRVCAKLSIEDDAHLAREATVYQALPAHLAEHWSGYNLVRPSHNPVPVRAVVPQFYGYYAPVPAPDPEAAYLSPVMLLENCGVPLEARVLSADERAECWSLVYRLHHAGWAHGSVAARNIVVQPGPMTAPQGWLRGPELSFRVIDFGRSLYCGAKADSDGAEDVHEGFRPRGDANETIRLEKDLVDRLLSQGIHGS